eukprot:TRINITY_DN22211_c0_g1_i1.p1 TRINITY_DN22211_c0_g1~~TRINITY_DN22211_c0_g1_i1.p1  ORF type:complete len:222 (+),score=60.32 TRINITY_DN22211_c0_g1_i1:77-742(+)
MSTCSGRQDKQPIEDASAGGKERLSHWSKEQADELQQASDFIFKTDDGQLGGLAFSFSIADPLIEGCPLIGCSTGFGTLCGYSMEEIVGRNCRFLVDPVPKDQVCSRTRTEAREFCEKVASGKDPDAQELLCIQTNAKKDGALFRNLFYLVKVELDDKPYILGLQTELPMQEDEIARAAVRHACRLLDRNLAYVQGVLAKRYWYSGPLRRQDEEEVINLAE